MDGIATLYKPKDIQEIEAFILSFLTTNSLTQKDIDLVITGKNCDAKEDKTYEEIQQGIFSNNQLIHYKNLCGEYPTSVSFALWMAANILKTGTVPAATGYQGPKQNKLKKLLIYNHYQQTHHSLLLVSGC